MYIASTLFLSYSVFETHSLLSFILYITPNISIMVLFIPYYKIICTLRSTSSRCVVWLNKPFSIDSR